MKKIALCLYGKFNNRFSEKSGVEGMHYIEKMILSHPDVDVFIHSWDTGLATSVKELYSSNLVKSCFEEQISFDAVIKENNINEKIFSAPGGQSFRTLQNSLSFFYSRKKSIDLKKEYELANDFTYDVVVCSRFDLGQMDKYVGYQDYRVSEISFDPNYDMEFIYSAMWNQLNDGFADMWFYSSSQNIDILAKMYDRCLSYYKEESEYINTLQSGWPDSNNSDYFSNEFFKNNKTSNKRKYSKADAHNNHIIHKWFMIDSSLYEKCKFLTVSDDRFGSMYYSLHNSMKLNKKRVNLCHKEYFVTCDEKSFYNDLCNALKDAYKGGVRAIQLEDLDSDYSLSNYTLSRSSVDFVLENKMRRLVSSGFDLLELKKSKCSFGIPLPSLYKIYISILNPFRRIYLGHTIWKISTLLKILENKKNIKKNKDGYYIYTTKFLKYGFVRDKRSRLKFMIEFIKQNIKK